MESSSTTAGVPRSIPVPSSRRLNRSNHRLFFDRRYGWVFDEWKHPSREALAGGRGMFCILPLAQCLFKRASDSFLQRVFSMETIAKPLLPAMAYNISRNLSFFTRIFTQFFDPEGIANVQKSLGLRQEEKANRVR